MVEKEEIITLTNEVFAQEFELEKEKLVPEAQLFDDLGLDSLDVVDLIVGLQQKFDVSIRDDERIRSIRTLQDVHEFVYTIQEEMAAEKSAAS